MRQLLQRNSEELSGVVTALGGGYVLPEAGGDLLRDGPGVLPTGGRSFICVRPCSSSCRLEASQLPGF